MDTPSPTVPAPIRIDPTAIYTTHEIILALGIPSATLDRARRCGDLPHVRRGRTTYITGRALLAWLTPRSDGEVRS